MSLCLGFEAIAAGREEMMLCGGADEFHLLTSATFDRLGAASHIEDPDCASRPFDAERTGIVCGEGAGILLLESLESAQARNAPILAEIRGAAISSSPGSIAQPDAAAIAGCMVEAAAALRRGEVVCLMGDRMHGTRQAGQGVDVAFMKTSGIWSFAAMGRSYCRSISARDCQNSGWSNPNISL